MIFGGGSNLYRDEGCLTHALLTHRFFLASREISRVLRGYEDVVMQYVVGDFLRYKNNAVISVGWVADSGNLATMLVET